MQLGGSQKLGRFASGIMKAARASRELRSEAVASNVDAAPESGVQLIGAKTADAAKKVIEGRVETVN